MIALAPNDDARRGWHIAATFALAVALSVACDGEVRRGQPDTGPALDAAPRDAPPQDTRPDGEDTTDAKIGPTRDGPAADRPPTDLGGPTADAVPHDKVIKVGESWQRANDQNAAGTVFLIKAGTHVKQKVHNPKAGNTWIGEKGAIADGNDAIGAAFTGTANGVTIRRLELRNYRDNGVAFSGGKAIWIDAVTVTNTGSGSGEANGALRFDNMTDIKVTGCRFERVSSGVLPTGCTGPIVIERNTGLNIGRNMVQLANCSGGGIRVRYNSMVRDGSYVRPGNDDVEDWISVFAVQGLASDYAEFSFNRAKGHGPSTSGSFIMLGDGGGKYQRAVGNIGVTCGQVGVGLSGGHHIEVRNNVMYSAQWSGSNIAFYSADYGQGGCSNHVVSGNRANWINKSGQQNDFWSDGKCTPLSRSGNTFPDVTVSAAIWSSWKPGP